MTIYVTKEQVPYGIGILYLAMLALIVGGVMSLNSGFGLDSDPASRLYNVGFVAGLLMVLGGILGVFKCTTPMFEWQPKTMDPMCRPWRMKTPGNAAISLGFLLLVASIIPAGIFAAAWRGRVHWARADVPTEGLNKPNLISGKWAYSFSAEGHHYLAFDKVGAPLPSKTQTIWYNPSVNENFRIGDCHIGAKPPLFNPIIFGLFLNTLFIFWGLFAVILLRTLRQIRANDEWDLAAPAA